MNFKEYEDTVLKHAFYPNRGNNLPYATLGLTGEAGEVANDVKKIQRDAGGVINETAKWKIAAELGDVLWYIAAAASEIGLTLDDIARINVEKLAARHGTNDKGEVTNTLEKFTKTRFKVGDRVVVREKLNGHEFHIGTVGVVDEVNTAARSYRVKNGFGELWWLADYELGSLETETENIRHIRSKPFPF